MSGVADVEDELKSFQIGLDKGDINIIILGENSVRKSTFINAFANYLTYTSFETAQKEKVFVLAPLEFTLEAEDEIIHRIVIGLKDIKDYQNNRASLTQEIVTYVFPIGHNQTTIQIIDTPGLENVTEIDDINCENILNYINNLHELHAICFLFTSSDIKRNCYLDFYMKQFFSRLDKSASKNILFIFDETSDSSIDTESCVNLLRKHAEFIHQKYDIEIPVKNNIFYFSNDAFKYLVAYKNSILNTVLKESNAQQSWNKSTIQSWRLLRYIKGGTGHEPLRPYIVKNTNSINDARRMIEQLLEPLADIIQLIGFNINLLETHQRNLFMEESDLEVMKKKLSIPMLMLEVIKLNHPITVCVDCAKVVKIEEINEWHFSQECHKPCYLTNVRHNHVDDNKLMQCVAMDELKKCIKCICDYSVHKHIYYMTKIKRIDREDTNVKKPDNREKILEFLKHSTHEIEKIIEELKNEHSIILITCARFRHFLQKYSITPFKDKYRAYMEYLINREKSLGETLCNANTIHYLENSLQEYETNEQFIDENIRLLGQTDAGMSVKHIFNDLQKLYKLTHTGKKIKELYDCQKNPKKKEYESTMYVSANSSKQPKETKEVQNTPRNRGFEKKYDSNCNEQLNAYGTSSRDSNIHDSSRTTNIKPGSQKCAPGRQNHAVGPQNHSSRANDYRPAPQHYLSHENLSRLQSDLGKYGYSPELYNYSPGPQNNPPGPPNNPFGPQTYPSEPQNNPPGTHNHPLGRQNYPPGPQNIPPGPQNILPGPQNNPPGTHNHSLGRQNYPPGPQNIPPEPQNIPPGPQNIPPGPQRHVTGPHNYPPRTHDYPPPQYDYNAPQNHPPGSQNHPTEPHNYPPRTHDYLPSPYDYKAGPHHPIGPQNHPPGLQNHSPGLNDHPPQFVRHRSNPQRNQRDPYNYRSNFTEKNRRFQSSDTSTRKQFKPKNNRKKVEHKIQKDSSSDSSSSESSNSESSSIDTSEPSD